VEGEVRGSSLWGSSSADVYAVGLGEGVRHDDGRSWSEQHPVQGGYENVAASGTSSSNVFVVGDGGSVLRYDGSAWQPQNRGSDDVLVAVWVASTTDAFALAAWVADEGFVQGAILRYRP